MKRLMFAVFVFAAITLTLADTNKKEIIAFTPLQVRWFTPPSLNILHHQKVRSRLTRNVVQHDNIRVIQGRNRLRLPPESGQSLCILGYLIGQKLQSHKAMQPRILGFVDHTHPATAELIDDTVVRDGLADHGIGPS